jgi:2-methylisocitrate lyase-like PEP mutase family enzyme
MDLRTIAVRAFVTFIEAATGALVASGVTDLTIERAQAVVLAGAAAVVSVVYNASRHWLDTHPA